MKGLRFITVCVLLGLLLAGCGSSTPTAASPAPLAPASSVLYLELTVRPQGNQQAAVEGALTRLIGHSPDSAIRQLVAHLLHTSGLTYSDLQPWLGQRIGIVVTSFSADGVGLILPTSDPPGALTTLKRVERAARVAPATYRGVHFLRGTDHGRPVAFGTVGRAGVLAAPRVFTQIVDASRGRSLKDTAGFRSALAGLPADSLMRGYVNVSAIRTLVVQRLQAGAGAGAISPRIEHELGSTLGNVRGAVGFSLTADARAFTFDVRATAGQPTRGGDVSGLPGQSWLALATSGFNARRAEGLLSALRGNPGVAAFLGGFRDLTGLDLLHQVLPALGPLELSIQGTSPLEVGGGLVITPSELTAAQQVLAGIRRLAARSGSLVVQGSNRSFSITRSGLPIPRILVAEVGKRIVATVDEPFASLLKPLSTLSANPRFASARSRLPAGSRVSLFVDFRSIGQLLADVPAFHSTPTDQKVLSAVQRLDYLVLASDAAQHRTRLVLALR